MAQKVSLTITETQNLQNLQNLYVDSQIPHFQWTLHNGRRKIHLGYSSVTNKTKLIEYRRNGNQWENNQSLRLQREEYNKLMNKLPSY